MTRSQLDNALKTVIGATADRLKSLGFRRSGSTLRLVRDNMSGVLQFQRSTKSAGDRVLFTVNVGVVCGALLPSRIKLEEAQVMDAHSWERLGMLAHREFDKWWSIDSDTDVERLAAEISDLVANAAIPFIERFMSPSALIELWESGKSFGLTDGKRKDLLAQLRTKQGDTPSLIGRWSLDPADTAAMRQLGSVVMDFEHDGRLTYTVRGGARDQVMILRYRLDGATIVTDQDSAPKEERTKFELSNDVLTLEMDGVQCRFLREKA